MKKSYIFALVTLFSLASCSITVCNSVDLSYDILSYSNIDACFAGAGMTQQYAITAAHEVLTLDSTSQKYVYKPVTSLVVGDVVQSPIGGTTTITGISTSSISLPFITLAQMFSEDTYTNNQFSPYNPTPLLRWVAADPSTHVDYVKPIITTGYVGGTYNLDYQVPFIENDQIDVLLNTFNSANMQNIGSFTCNGTSYDFYYYTVSTLLRPLCLDVFYRAINVMSVSDYFGMIDYAISQPGGIFYDGTNVVYSYSLSTPSCSATTITTADGYLIVNGIILS